jgi:hypothetical protein
MLIAILILIAAAFVVTIMSAQQKAQLWVAMILALVALFLLAIGLHPSSQSLLH